MSIQNLKWKSNKDLKIQQSEYNLQDYINDDKLIKNKDAQLLKYL